jgi:DNA-binding MarR family transcriptional regulator
VNSVQEEERARLCDVVPERDDSILMRTRRLSRAVTEIYDIKLRPFHISAIQFALLELIGRTEPVTRAAIARSQHLEKSTLTRNLRAIFSEGWIKEVPEQADGRSRPITLTDAGKQRLLDAAPAWHAAESEVEAVLGEEALIAIMDGVEHLTRPPAVHAAPGGISRTSRVNEHPSAGD